MNKLVALVSIVLLSLIPGSAAVAQQVNSFKCLAGDDINFMFDGGSLVFRFRPIKSGDAGFELVVLHPKSFYHEKFGPDIKFVATPISRSDDAAARAVSNKELNVLIEQLFGCPEQSSLNTAVLGYLLSMAHGKSATLWGHEAVESLRKGDWVNCFKNRPLAEEKGDPFAR